MWDATTAEQCDKSSAFMFAPDVLDPAVAFLAELAGDGPALEMAIGTGRVAIPLAKRGISVTGIELSQPMADQLHRKMATTRLGCSTTLLWLAPRADRPAEHVTRRSSTEKTRTGSGRNSGGQRR